MKKLVQPFFKLLILLPFLLFFGAVQGQKIRCFVLSPAEKTLEGVKKLAVLDFESQRNKGKVLADYMITRLVEEERGIRDQVSSGLFSTQEGRTYIKGVKTDIYQVIERSQLDKVFEEQKLNLSGAIDDATAAEVGRILGLDVMVLGSVDYSHKDEKQTKKYKDKNGRVHYKYCTKRTVTTEARMRIISVESAQIIGTHTAKKAYYDFKCDEKRSGLSPVGDLVDRCLKDISVELVNYFTPRFVYSTYKLERYKLRDYRKKAKDAEDFAENGDIKRAYPTFKAIYDQDSYNPIAAYNLGIFHEIVGDYEKAYELYGVAYQLAPDEKDYADAYRRAEKGKEMAAMLEEIGVPIEKYEFQPGMGNALADKVETKGSGRDRYEVKAAPSESADVVAKVPGGLEFELIEKDGDWYLIKLLGGKQGYIHKKDVN